MTGLEAVEHQLQAPAPAGLRNLAEADLLAFAAAVRAARNRQAAELAAAGDKAFALVPRILRGPIRRMFG
jgi:hypothetical protein